MATATKLDATKWVGITFSYNGIEYVSRFSPDSPLLMKVLALPSAMFEELHAGLLKAEIGTTTDREEIQKELDRLNAGASYALIELA